MKGLLKNPVSLWIKWWVAKCWYGFKYRQQHLEIQYMARFSDSRFGQYNTLYEGAALTQVKLGSYSYVGANSRLLRVTVGKFCCIGPDVIAGLGRHPSSDFVSIHPVFYSPNAKVGTTFADRSYFDETDHIMVGNDVWIGARAIIVDGVSICDGAIIAAGAVVTRDVPPYAIVGGVPAKIIRYRFAPHQIDALLASKWWDKEESWLRKNFEKFHHIDALMPLLAEESEK